ncbi:MAG: hypothetical protein M3Q89_09000, partial [Verrucomicrobiota bacterium]|nr:hypothetical protein [Verrucomicrobiota bacterium]
GLRDERPFAGTSAGHQCDRAVKFFHEMLSFSKCFYGPGRVPPLARVVGALHALLPTHFSTVPVDYPTPAKI